MSDIVEWLRLHASGIVEGRHAEAAAEIERLRAENKWLRTVVGEYATIDLAKAGGKE